MKFGHALLLEEQAAPKELQGRFLQYKALKKMLKRRLLSAAAQPNPSGNQALEAEKDFLRVLRCQLKEVDRKFSADAEAILSHHDIVGGKKSKNPLQTLLTCKLVLRKSQSPEALLKLQQRVIWTKKYAELNATALRKIAKKRDKLCGGKVGQCFLQACFRGQVAIHAILSMPILRELTAVEQLLERRLATPSLLPAKSPAMTLTEAAPIETAQCRVDHPEANRSSANGGSTNAAKGSDEDEIEKDYTCAVCMDVLFKPVALECGHIYCARCAISTAVGHDRTIGDVEHLLGTIAAYSAAYANRPCPACRSTVHGKDGENVYWQIRRMKHLDRLIQEKFPEEWQRRKAEDAEEQAALKAKRADNSCFKGLKCCRS